MRTNVYNSPAFPTDVGSGEDGGFQCGNERWHDPGMSLRDYFAAKAMQGAFTSPIESSADGKDYIAMHAYKMADAMLKARGA